MIAVYKIGSTGRNLRDHKAPLCGSSDEETEAGVRTGPEFLGADDR